MALEREALRQREIPECVRLPVRPGHAPSGKPPVRIFLGSEASQFRPERVLAWSIEQVRDPGREYEIHLMKELASFDRTRWTTGFTNYRFAIPHFADGRGRAIYNDEDQLYLTDPAELFDLEMGDKGFLAISATESSVMLIDCERMADIWTLERARKGRKKALIGEAVSAGRVGDLDPHWNARDAEYRQGRSHLLHYTTLHTQPWHPFPDRFVYRDHPLGHLWHDLERSADVAGFQLFDREQPSSRFAAARAAVPLLEQPSHPRLDDLIQAVSPESVQFWHPRAAPDGKRADAVVCSRGLESMPEDDLPWLLDELFDAADRYVFAAVDSSDTPTQIAPTQTETQTAPDRWRAHFGMASRRHPEVHWDLLVTSLGADGRTHDRFYAAGPRHTQEPPSVWVASDPEPEHTESARALLDALGWSARTLESRAVLAPPWPDLLIACGPGTENTVETLRERSLGRTRVVAIGAGARVSDVDLSVATVSDALLPQPTRFEIASPLVARADVDPNEERAWRERFDRAAGPRVALIVEAGRAPFRVTSGEAARIGAAVRESAGPNATVFVVCEESLHAVLHDAVRDPFEICEPDRAGAAYRALLKSADRIVVTGNAEHRVADACATGTPVELIPVIRRGGGPVERLRTAVARLAEGAPENNRGTTRPQQGLERLCSRLIARGTVQPPRDIAAFEQSLVERGVAARLGAQPAGPLPEILDEAARVSERVRSLLGIR
jgi:hypothetical protein